MFPKIILRTGFKNSFKNLVASQAFFFVVLFSKFSRSREQQTYLDFAAKPTLNFFSSKDDKFRILNCHTLSSHQIDLLLLR